MNSSNEQISALNILFYLSILGVIYLSLDLGGRIQWDYRVYYFSAKAYSMGINPYDKDTISEWANTRVNPYVYPPPTLFFFWILSLVDYEASAHIFLGLKFIVLGVLLYLWGRVLDNKVDVFYYVFVYWPITWLSSRI